MDWLKKNLKLLCQTPGTYVWYGNLYRELKTKRILQIQFLVGLTRTPDGEHLRLVFVQI